MADTPVQKQNAQPMAPRRAPERSAATAAEHADDAAPTALANDFPARPFLSTRRLRLRELCLADIPALTAMNADADVARTLVEPCPTDYLGIAKLIFHANACYLMRPASACGMPANLAGTSSVCSR